MGHVTINIKNCGCCGGSSAGGTTSRPPFSQPGDPNSPAGPPDGFSIPTSGLSDRQCKMAVWLYDWLQYCVDSLGNTSEGRTILIAVKTAKYAPFVEVLAPIIGAFVGFVVTLFAIPGIGPDDAAGGIIGWVIGLALVNAVAQVEASQITQPTFQTALPIIQAAKDEIICQLAQATSATDAQARLETALADKLETEQQLLILSFMPDMFLNLLFFSADWWPSFDEDYLAGITDTCCGGYVNDDPIVPGSVQSCQAANFIIDKLASTFYNVYQLQGIWTNFNPFDSNRETIYSTLEGYNLADPLIKTRAYSYSAFLSAVTEFIYSQYSFLAINLIDLVRWFDLSTYFFTNHDALVTALQAAADKQAAYDAFDPVRTWLDDVANIEEEYQPYMLDALEALIRIDDTKPDILDLLFYQESDVSSYAVADCAGAGGASGYLTSIVAVNILKSHTSVDDENLFLGAPGGVDDAGGMKVGSSQSGTCATVDGDFGAVYNNATELQFHVRGWSQLEGYRILEKVTVAVKEDIGDAWQSIGVAYVNQSSLNDGTWEWRKLSFSARNVRYARFSFDRGFSGTWGYRWFDSAKVITE